MKRFYTTLLIILAVEISMFAQMRLTVMKPASVNIGNHISKIGIIDRSAPEKKWVGIVEGIATGEGIGLDTEAKENVIAGLMDVLRESPKFTIINTAVKLKTPFVPGGLPPALNWREVDRLCKKYGCDAILSLEFFDTDFVITNSQKVEEQKDKDGKVTKVKVFYAEGVGTLKIGYRLYDPQNRSIVDELVDQRNGTWNAKGRTAQEAAATLMNRKAAIISMSKTSGSMYGKRISPHWITVYRHFYRKPKKDHNFITGVRKAQTNNWEGALEDWINASNNSPKKKVRKRAMFNIALAYEVLGDLDNARKWAQDTYSGYGLKKARDYVRVIENRMWQEQRLEEQMSE